jgi:hypothetical protein
VREALARVERRFRRLSEARAAADLRADLDTLESEWQEVDWQGQKAGLKACADHELWAFSGEWGKPLFLREFRGYLRRVGTRIRALKTIGAMRGRRAGIRYFARLRDLANTFEAEVGSYDPPNAVVDQAFNYQDALYRLSTTSDRMATLARHLPLATLAQRPALRRWIRAVNGEHRKRVALAVALAATLRESPPAETQQSS